MSKYDGVINHWEVHLSHGTSTTWGEPPNEKTRYYRKNEVFHVITTSAERAMELVHERFSEESKVAIHAIQRRAPAGGLIVDNEIAELI